MTSSHFAQNSIILIHIDLQLVLLFNLVIIILFRYCKDFTSTFYGKSNKGERRKFQDKCLMGIFTARQRSCGRVMFYTCLSVHRCYDVTSCLTIWSHVLSRGYVVTSCLTFWSFVPPLGEGVSVRRGFHCRETP